MKPVYFLLAILILFSCEDDEFEFAHIRINHFKQSAVGVGPTLVLLTQEDDNIGTDNWQYHYSGISGFNYEWGYIYDLKISKRRLDNPPEDGSSVEYILEEIISKTSVDQNTSFELILKSETMGIVPAIVIGNAISGFKLIDEQKINCSNLCEELGQSLNEKNEVIGSFKYDTTNQLLLLELKPD